MPDSSKNYQKAKPKKSQKSAKRKSIELSPSPPGAHEPTADAVGPGRPRHLLLEPPPRKLLRPRQVRANRERGRSLPGMGWFEKS